MAKPKARASTEAALVSVADAARTLGVSQDSVRRLLRDGVLEERRIRRRRLVTADSIRQLTDGAEGTQ